ncbi:hypothetical protein [Vibrio sp. MA40-2]|uniref:hypothetical protein n=1 Tax=Vibrio sp. MA40-2 TaxID=3391828 RepID=UPI0039A755AE
MLVICTLLTSLLMMSFSVSANVVLVFSDYNICPIDAEMNHGIYSKSIDAANHADVSMVSASLDIKTKPASHSCGSAMCTLYPPSAVVHSSIVLPAYSLAPIEDELNIKTNYFSQSLYKPPIA